MEKNMLSMENIFFAKVLDETHNGLFYHRETFEILLNNVNDIIAEYYDQPEKSLYLIELFYTIIEYGNIITIHSIIDEHISIISENLPKYEKYNIEELTLIILFSSLVNPSFNKILLTMIKKIKSSNPEIIFPFAEKRCPYIISWFRSSVPNDFEIFCYGYNLVEYTMNEIINYISKVKFFEPSIILNDSTIDINCGKLRLLFRYFKKKNSEIFKKTIIVQDKGMTREYMSLLDIKFVLISLLSN